MARLAKYDRFANLLVTDHILLNINSYPSLASTLNSEYRSPLSLPVTALTRMRAYDALAILVGSGQDVFFAVGPGAKCGRARKASVYR